MKRFSVGMFILIAMCVVFMIVPGGLSAQEQFDGVVLNLYGQPLSGVTVVLADKEMPTTASGTFSFGGDPVGEGMHDLVIRSRGDVIHTEVVHVRNDEALRIFVNDDRNLLPNPGFEIGFNENGYPIGWRGSPYFAFGNEFQLDEENTHSGQKALKIKYPSNRTGGIHIRTDEQAFSLPVEPGDVFHAKAYAYNDRGNRIVMMLTFLDANNREISGAGRTVSTENTTWTELTLTSRPAPDNAAQIRLMFWQSTDTRGSVTYVDDVHLIKQDMVEEASEGGIRRIPPQVQKGEHPRLYVTRAEIEAVQQLTRQNPALRLIINEIINVPARRIVWDYEDREITFPAKPPNNQGEAIRRSADPIHQRFAKDASTAALGFAYTGNKEMGETAKRILLTYADQYMNFTHRAVREGRLTSETREEALWLIEMAWAYDLILDSDLLNQVEKNKIEAMLREAERIVDGHRIARQDINWQAGHNAAIMAAGVVLEDREMIEKVLVGPKSFSDLIVQSVRLDGMTHSQSVSHHLFAVDRWLLVAEAAYRNGYDIYGYDFGGRTLKDLIDVPYYYVFHHGEHPLTGHAAYGSRLAFKWTDAVAFQRYGDSRYFWLWRQDGIRNYRNQSESRRIVFYLPTLYNADLSQEPKHTVSFGPIGARGHNVSGSTLFEDSGFAILRGASEDGIRLESILLFKPHGTVNGHQGSDNLTMMLSGKESVWIPGTGGGSYAYDRPEQRGWYEQTVARSGVVVDELPQYPLSEADISASATRYAMDRGGRTSAGKLLNFIALPSASFASATTDNVYVGVDMKRTLLMSAPYMIDRYDVHSDDEHLYDWVVHVKAQEGSIDIPQTSRPGPLGENPGYQYMTKVRSGQSEDTWTATWTKPNETMQLIMIGGEETEVVRAEGIGESVHVPQPLVVARRWTEGTQFVALYELYRDSPTISDLSTIAGADFQGLRVNRVDGKADQWVWSKESEARRHIDVEPGLGFNGREAFFRPADAANVQSALLIDGTFVEMDGISIQADTRANLALESLGRDVIAVSQSGGRGIRLTVTLSDDFHDSYRIFQLGTGPANDGTIVAKEVSGGTQQLTENNLVMTWNAEPYGVYVIAPREPSQQWLDRYAFEMAL